MHSKLFLVEALAALSSASIIPFPFTTQDPVCAPIQFVAPAFPLQSDAAKSFCTSAFGIEVTTATQVATVTQPATSTTFGATTITVAPNKAQATYSSTQTCFQNTLIANPANKYKREPEAEAAAYVRHHEPNVNAKIFGFDSTDQLSSICSCYGVNFNPATTVSSTKTSTAVVATVTKITATSTVSAAGSQATSGSKSGVYTTYIQPNGTYVAADGVYTDYSGYDFNGYDLVSGVCGAASNKVSTTAGNFACNGFKACQDVCASYNGKKAARDPACLGVTWQSASQYCYLKNAVPGNGAPNCAARVDSNCQSAIKGKVVPPY